MDMRNNWTPELLSKLTADYCDGTPDSNIFGWYKRWLELEFPPALQIVDWGAGLGRFAEFYIDQGVDFVDAVEPTLENFKALKEQLLDTVSPEKLMRIKPRLANMGDYIPRQRGRQVLHTANFVINCCENFTMALCDFCNSMQPGERGILFANVVVPESLYSTLSVFPKPIKIMESNDDVAIPPDDSMLELEIESDGTRFNDRAHTLFQYRRVLELRDDIVVRNSALLLPVGFKHHRSTPESFKDQQFCVLQLELSRIDV